MRGRALGGAGGDGLCSGWWVQLELFAGAGRDVPVGSSVCSAQAPAELGQGVGRGLGVVLDNTLNHLECHWGGGSCHRTNRFPIGRPEVCRNPLRSRLGLFPNWGRTRLIPGDSGVTAAAPETAGARLPPGTLVRGSTPRLCHWWKVSWAGAECPSPSGLALSTP